MRRRPVASLVLLLALVLGMAACTEEPTASGPRPRAGAAVHAAHNDTSTPFNLVSLPALIEHEYDGRDLRLDHVMARELSFTRHHVTYRSGGLTVSGTLTVPSRPGRFPLLVLAHGWQNPAQYDNATATQEQAWLAARGYAVLQPDYRNYGQSDPQPATPVARPLGYPEDVVNAIVATRRARLPFVDTSRVGWSAGRWAAGRAGRGGSTPGARGRARAALAGQLAGRGQLPALGAGLGRPHPRRGHPGARAGRGRRVRHPGGPAAGVARGERAALPGPGRRTGAAAPRRRRRGLPGGVEPGHGRGAA